MSSTKMEAILSRSQCGNKCVHWILFQSTCIVLHLYCLWNMTWSWITVMVGISCNMVLCYVFVIICEYNNNTKYIILHHEAIPEGKNRYIKQGEVITHRSIFLRLNLLSTSWMTTNCSQIPITACVYRPHCTTRHWCRCMYRYCRVLLTFQVLVPYACACR